VSERITIALAAPSSNGTPASRLERLLPRLTRGLASENAARRNVLPVAAFLSMKRNSKIILKPVDQCGKSGIESKAALMTGHRKFG
jgi:hypothetical protein